MLLLRLIFLLPPLSATLLAASPDLSDVAKVDRERILAAADAALKAEPYHHHLLPLELARTKPDVQSWEGWPTRQSALLFSSIAFEESKYFDLWKKLTPDPEIEEIERNVALTQPLLWLPK